MNTCKSCGIMIPDGQETCSMCYGDIAHGNAGYYEDWNSSQSDSEEEREWEERGE